MTTPTRSGIPTTYRGTNFRSRLEARWAAFFDLVGWSWVYEPLDADGYIPDFLINGPRPFFVEVGPCVTEDDYRRKSAKASANATVLRADVLVVGVDARSPFTTSWESYGGAHGSPGLLGEYHEAEDDEPSLSFGVGVWTTCRESETRGERAAGCGRLGVAHDDLSYVVRPCGHYPGGRIHEPIGTDVRALWAEAGNLVQWRRAA